MYEASRRCARWTIVGNSPFADERGRRPIRRPSSHSTIRPAPRRLIKVGAWLVGVVLVIVLLNLLGVDVVGWLKDLWDQIQDVPAGYIVAALVFQTGQTLFAGLSYYGILRAAYPGQVEFWPIVTAYAVGVSMNNFLPANIGTFVTLLMFVAIIPAATFGGSIAAYLVQKIFFTIAGTFVYLYLFLSVPGSFDANLGNLSEHPVGSIVIAAGVVVLVVLLVRIFWRQVKKLWLQAKQGGAILSRPKEYLTRAFLPSFLSWLCKLAVIGIFLAAFAIPVTFESIMWVTGSGSLANVVSFTPGAVGITQATNALALDTCCNVADGDRGRLLDRPAAHHDRLERHRRARPRRPRVRMEWREAARRSSPTAMPRSSWPSRRPSGRRRSRKSARSGSGADVAASAAGTTVRMRRAPPTATRIGPMAGSDFGLPHERRRPSARRAPPADADGAHRAGRARPRRRLLGDRRHLPGRVHRDLPRARLRVPGALCDGKTHMSRGLAATVTVIGTRTRRHTAHARAARAARRKRPRFPPGAPDDRSQQLRDADELSSLGDSGAAGNVQEGAQQVSVSVPDAISRVLGIAG